MSRDHPLPPSAAGPSARSRRRLLAACAGLALLAGCAADAIAQGRLVHVEVVDRDSGRALPVFHARGETFVAGRPGARYALRVDNRSGERVMVVVAIDGVNIVTGETASVDQDGYVLGPGQVATLTGWRKSLGEVAAFEFARLPDSYAARTGRPDDVGAIGVAVFRERRPPPVAMRPQVGPVDANAPASRDAADANAPPPWTAAAPGAQGAAPVARGAAKSSAAPPAALRDEAAPALRRQPVEPSERLGTGHGAREQSWVAPTSFERLTARPSELLRLRYDSLPDLVAAGIAPAPPRTLATMRPFPADPAPGFVPDPPPR
ncbi:MAG: hypothetical protein ACTHL8_24970 [Burkholderiaceae bacterium]